MSSALYIHMEIKREGSNSWESVKFDTDRYLYYQGAVRDYFGNGCESELMPTDLTKETKDAISEVGYVPRIYVRTLSELSKEAENLRIKWLKSYKEALSKNFFVKKLEEVMCKTVKDEDEDWFHSEERIEYLENEEIWDWVCLENLHSVLCERKDCLENPYKIEEARVVMYIC